jgi:hypothetical protein
MLYVHLLVAYTYLITFVYYFSVYYLYCVLLTKFVINGYQEQKGKKKKAKAKETDHIRRIS